MTPVIKNKTNRLSGPLFRWLPFVLAALLWVVLIFRGQFYLKKVEDLSLFMFDWLYFKEAFSIPGGPLGLAGSFFTQFLYYPWLGSLIWIAILLITYQLTIKAFNIPEQLRALAIIPAALLIIGNMSLGYGVFIMREQDHFFAPVLGYIIALIPVFAAKRIKPIWAKAVLIALWTACGFPLFGTFALAGTLAVASITLTDSSLLRQQRFALLAAGIAFILLIPLVYYNFYTSYRLADSWHLGLPSISNDAWTRAVRAPLQLALLFIIVMALAARKLKADNPKPLIPTVVYIASIACIWAFWYKDCNFRTELAMSEAVDRFDWQQVIDIYQKTAKAHAKSDAKAYQARTKALASVQSADEKAQITDKYSSRFFEPTRTMVLYRDLALLKTNRALEEAFTMKDGGRRQKSRTQIPMAFQSGKQLYLQYGLVNMSYRWCLEDVIEHNWSFSTLKYLAMHCIIMQEGEFSHKYLNKLRKTIFYRRWANEQYALAHDSTLMASSEPYKSILPYMCFENRMSNDLVKSEAFLFRHFTEPEPPHPTPEYDRAALLWAMRTQDIQLFWQRFFCYIRSNNVTQLPRGVQEAALLYSSLEKNSLELPYSKSVKDSYDSFTRFVKANPVRNIKESAYPYSQKFGKTFYYFYYFMRDLQTY